MQKDRRLYSVVIDEEGNRVSTKALMMAMVMVTQKS